MGGPNYWSEYASSKEPGEASKISQSPTSTATLIPIVVGIILALIVVVLIIIFMVRRKRAGNTYDAEKAENGRKSSGAGHLGNEETQKLKDNPEV